MRFGTIGGVIVLHLAHPGRRRRLRARLLQGHRRRELRRGGHRHRDGGGRAAQLAGRQPEDHLRHPRAEQLGIAAPARPASLCRPSAHDARPVSSGGPALVSGGPALCVGAGCRPSSPAATRTRRHSARSGMRRSTWSPPGGANPRSAVSARTVPARPVASGGAARHAGPAAGRSGACGVRSVAGAAGDGAAPGPGGRVPDGAGRDAEDRSDAAARGTP